MQKALNKHAVETAKPYFEHYPTAKEVLVVEDGNVFLEHNKADGAAYAASQKLPFTLVNRDDLDATFPEEGDETNDEPSEKWTVVRLTAWLTEKEITFDPKIKKAEIMKLIEDFKSKQV
jgi:hypothetical protein